MHWFLIIVGLLHLAFMLSELFPWSQPVLLGKAGKNLDPPFTTTQLPLVATIVHNAGIYNGILAGGLFWAAVAGESAVDVARVLLIGAIAAGAFGTATLKSPFTALQAIAGIVGLFLVKT